MITRTMTSKGRNTYGQTIATVTIDLFDAARQPSPDHFWDQRMKQWRDGSETIRTHRPHKEGTPCLYCRAPLTLGRCVDGCGGPQA